MSTTGITERYLNGLNSRELLLKLTWNEWLAIRPPYSDGKFTTADATARYQRNGYDWDMHGSSSCPRKRPIRAGVLFFFMAGRAAKKSWT